MKYRGYYYGETSPIPNTGWYFEAVNEDGEIIALANSKEILFTKIDDYIQEKEE